MLSSQLSRHFRTGVRDKGRSYHQQGRVDILSIESDGSVEAEVRGGETYFVMLTLDRGSSGWKIAASCTCPYIDSNLDFCKHIWATILAVEKRHPYSSAPSKIEFRLVYDGEEFGDDDGDSEKDSSGEGFGPSTLRIMRSIAGGGSTTKLLQDLTEAIRGREVRPRVTIPIWSTFMHKLATNSAFREPAKIEDVEPLAPLFVLETRPGERIGEFIISLAEQRKTATGRLGKPKKLSIKPSDINRVPDPVDRQICLLLVGAGAPDDGFGYGYYSRYRTASSTSQSRWRIKDEVRATLLPMLFQTGRFHMKDSATGTLIPLTGDEGGVWELFVHLQPSSQTRWLEMSMKLRRGDQRREIGDADWIVTGEPLMVIKTGCVSMVEGHGCTDWISAFQKEPRVRVPASDREKLFQQFNQLGKVPPVEWPTEWNITEVNDLAPKPELRLIFEDEAQTDGRGFARGEVVFNYGDAAVDCDQEGAFVFASAESRQIHRSHDAERAFLRRLRALGAESDRYNEGLRIPAKKVPAMLGPLLDEGWTVLGNRKLFRTAGSFAIDVTTGIDWFELNGSADFGGQNVGMPELLAAAKKGERFVRLGDGSMGMLPEQWIAQHHSLLELGRIEDGKVRYARTQIGLIDALLAQLPEATFDTAVTAAREKIRAFTGIAPRPAPEGFVGHLRGYQQEGVAWLHFLKELGWAGCLADDMGLGKTVQLLALILDHNRNGRSGPSLVVMPKSIVFNWIREAAQFAPELRVLDYTGSDRTNAREDLTQYDVILTTYGTLKRDIEFLSVTEFDYVVLDEAQAIKNPNSQNAKAARVLKARYRVAMTGTPVENHLGDLWSLFEFLNPGMLGSAPAFKNAFTPSQTSNPNDEQLSVLHRTLRPFILRRTKDQVAPELPQRTEQTIDCTMPAAQAAYYNELRDYYRQTLLGRVDRMGLAKSKVYVLEALLRLRQAACHPGLVDESKLEVESAKMNALLPMLSELIEGGHKALVFSQFTSLLSIVRRRLDDQGIRYEYLDGKTAQRDQKVDRFQKDSKCPLFLISLKAGGVGLNLTAADYVFLLDPWWNPAVEAQAIDRTHRIGQQKSVIAYRIIARDTVEAKIIELQRTKRNLADSIITQANSLIRTLTRDDLALLLS